MRRHFMKLYDYKFWICFYSDARDDETWLPADRLTVELYITYFERYGNELLYEYGRPTYWPLHAECSKIRRAARKILGIKPQPLWPDDNT